MLAPEGDEQVGSGPALGWAHPGLSAAAVFPLSALLGHWHAPLMFPLLLLPAFVPAVPLGLLTKSSCGRLSLNLFLLLGRFYSLCPVAWQEAGQLSTAGCCCKAKVQHVSGCSGGGEKSFPLFCL